MAELNVGPLASHILAHQCRDGRIAWIDRGIWDPWNHSEAAMGLAVAGEIDAAGLALDHLIETQSSDGSWTADMGCAAPMDASNERLVADGAPCVIDTNFCAYPAVLAWHLALITNDALVVRRAAPMITRMVSWLATLQSDGAFPWRAPQANERSGDIDALLAGNASIALSLSCAIRLLEALSQPTDMARALLSSLLNALKAPDGPRFAPKPRHAMDWYYPVLNGVMDNEAGRARLAARWSEFVEPKWGCRCVSDEPWATAAETAELVMACARVGKIDAAHSLLAALGRHADANGALSMGRQFALDVAWPREQPSWTAGAALLAIDALEHRTRGASIFTTLSPYDVISPLQPV